LKLDTTSIGVKDVNAIPTVKKISGSKTLPLRQRLAYRQLRKSESELCPRTERRLVRRQRSTWSQ